MTNKNLTELLYAPQMENKDVHSYGEVRCVSVQGHVKKVCQDETVPFNHLKNYVLIFKVTV